MVERRLMSSRRLDEDSCTNITDPGFSGIWCLDGASGERIDSYFLGLVPTGRDGPSDPFPFVDVLASFPGPQAG